MMGALVAHARARALANSQAQDDFLEVIIMACKNLSHISSPVFIRFGSFFFLLAPSPFSTRRFYRRI